MKAIEAFSRLHRVFLDSAPVIYHVQAHPSFFGRTSLIFQRIDDGKVEAVTSVITLAECLVLPMRRNDTILADRFRERIVGGCNTKMTGVDDVAEKAAELRARYNVSLIDAMQLACARAEGCDGFLTNDRRLARVVDLSVLVLADLEDGC